MIKLESVTSNFDRFQLKTDKNYVAIWNGFKAKKNNMKAI